MESTATTTTDRRWLLVTGFYATAAFSGFTQALSDNGLIYYLTALLMACFTTGWCVVDARRRGKPLLPVVQLIALLFWTIAVPIYLITSRGWRGLGFVLLNAVGLMAVFLMVFWATQYLAYGSVSLEP